MKDEENELIKNEDETLMAIVICRGYIIYAKSDNDELYDFFYPAMQNRMSISEAERIIPDNHKLLTTERVTRNYEIPMNKLEEYGKIIH